MTDLHFAEQQFWDWSSLLSWLVCCAVLLLVWFWLRRYQPKDVSSLRPEYQRIRLDAKASLHLLKINGQQYQIFESEKGQLLLRSDEIMDVAKEQTSD